MEEKVRVYTLPCWEHGNGCRGVAGERFESPLAEAMAATDLVRAQEKQYQPKYSGTLASITRIQYRNVLQFVTVECTSRGWSTNEEHIPSVGRCSETPAICSGRDGRSAMFDRLL